MPLAELAADLVFERTSLYRALRPVRRADLIAVCDGADRRAKDVTLTLKGERRIAAAMPRWIEAQRAVLDRFGVGAWDALASQLRDLTALASAVHRA